MIYEPLNRVCMNAIKIQSFLNAEDLRGLANRRNRPYPAAAICAILLPVGLTTRSQHAFFAIGLLFLSRRAHLADHHDGPFRFDPGSVQKGRLRPELGQLVGVVSWVRSFM
jgi:hypothetical protein